MKKLNKVALDKAKVMSAPQMKNITGGGYYGPDSDCYSTHGPDGLLFLCSYQYINENGSNDNDYVRWCGYNKYDCEMEVAYSGIKPSIGTVTCWD